MTRTTSVALLAAATLLLAGCRQGPGCTRALGVLAGTAAGAALGAAASPCYPGGGAFAGAALGMTAGSLVGDAIACEQERCGCAPCGTCRTCRGCNRRAPCATPQRKVIRRRVYIIEEEGAEPVPVEEVIIEEEVVDPCDGFGYGGR